MSVASSKGDASPSVSGKRRSERQKLYSTKGGEFFLETCKKNRDESILKVSTLINAINELVNDEKLEEAKVKVHTLVEVHKEFASYQSRYQDVLRQQPGTPSKEVTPTFADEVAQRVNNCVERVNAKTPNNVTMAEISNTVNDTNQHQHATGSGEDMEEPLTAASLEEKNLKRAKARQASAKQLESVISTAKGHIDVGNFDEAEGAQREIERLFDEFMEFAPDNYPELAEIANLEAEREWTHKVDGQVFEARTRLSEAKEKHFQPQTFKEQFSASKPPLPKQPPSRKSGSKKSYQGSQDGGASSHSSRSRSKGRSENRSKRSHSRCSNSTRSSGSSMSTRERAIDEKARLAALKVEAEFLDQAQKNDL